MAPRPTYIDLRSQSYNNGSQGASSRSPSSPRGLPSPRLHMVGDVPPTLSPLDAFAAQSRLLARQLDDTTKTGRRLSRLPPLTIENSLQQNRGGYFRSVPTEAPADATSPRSAGSELRTEIENPERRPVSVYPQMGGGVPSMPPVAPPRLDALDEEPFRGRKPPNAAEGPTYFGARREQSPAPFDREINITRPTKSPAGFQPRSSGESIRQRMDRPASHRPQDLGISGYDSRALAPPRSFAQRTPSLRSMSDSSDDDFAGRGQTLSPHRKYSGGSGMSMSPTAVAPGLRSIARSPSISSEISVGGTRLPKPSFNFSRPISRASTSGLQLEESAEGPSRQASSDSQPSFVLADDTANTPVSMHGEAFPDTSNDNGAAPSYVYSTFSLPRGKALQRNSKIFQETSTSQSQFPWEQPGTFSDFNGVLSGAPPSPPSRPSTSSRPETSHPLLDPGKELYEKGRASIDTSNPATREIQERPSSASAASSGASTIKASSRHSIAPATPATEHPAEEHLAKGIQYHEAGALAKSTYHLRLAARANLPTAMLLYALACRHGWGMRPNQREGVEWLRKAANSVSLEMADGETPQNEKAADLLERKTRKAQFALSVYELGVSHMNGWGIEQDKTLALRCFEIAGCKSPSDFRIPPPGPLVTHKEIC